MRVIKGIQAGKKSASLNPAGMIFICGSCGLITYYERDDVKFCAVYRKCCIHTGKVVEYTLNFLKSR